MLEKLGSDTGPPDFSAGTSFEAGHRALRQVAKSLARRTLPRPSPWPAAPRARAWAASWGLPAMPSGPARARPAGPPPCRARLPEHHVHFTASRAARARPPMRAPQPCLMGLECGNHHSNKLAQDVRPPGVSVRMRAQVGPPQNGRHGRAGGVFEGLRGRPDDHGQRQPFPGLSPSPKPPTPTRRPRRAERRFGPGWARGRAGCGARKGCTHVPNHHSRPACRPPPAGVNSRRKKRAAAHAPPRPAQPPRRAPRGARPSTY